MHEIEILLIGAALPANFRERAGNLLHIDDVFGMLLLNCSMIRLLRKDHALFLAILPAGCLQTDRE